MFLFGTLYQENSERPVDDTEKDENENAVDVDIGGAVEYGDQEDSDDGAFKDGGGDVEHGGSVVGMVDDKVDEEAVEHVAKEDGNDGATNDRVIAHTLLT